jgi:hypothetical protein
MRRASAGTAILTALLAGCFGQMGSIMLEDPRPAPESSASRTENAAADRCASGGLSEVIAARVIVELGGKPAEWVDVEVHGPAHDASRACEALVAELEREARAVQTTDDAVGHPAGGVAGAATATLALRVERACSSKAMPVATIDAQARLIDRRELDAIDLAIVARSAECPLAPSRLLRAVMLRQGSYSSMAQCESARARWLEATSATRERAETQAAAWLTEAIATAQARLAASCRDDAADAECAEQRRVLSLLRARRAGLTASDEPRDGGAEISPVDATSAAGGSLLCRPGVSRVAP